MPIASRRCVLRNLSLVALALACAPLGGCQWKMPETENKIAPPEPTRDPVEAEDLRRMLMADPAIVDVRAEPDRWEAIVADDGESRDRLALDICARLLDHGLQTAQMEVRVLDRSVPGRVLGHAFCAVSRAVG